MSSSYELNKVKQTEGIENPAFATDSSGSPHPQYGTAEEKGAEHKYTDLATIDPKFEQEDERNPNYLERLLAPVSLCIQQRLGKRTFQLKIAFLFAFLLLFLAYSLYCMYRDFERALPLLVFIGLACFFGLFRLMKLTIGPRIARYFGSLVAGRGRTLVTLRWVIYIALLIAVVIYISVFNRNNPDNLMSFGGYIVFLFLLFVFSANSARVKWRPVVGGILLQFGFGLLVLRTWWGYEAFKWLGDQVRIFLGYTDTGAIFVFGDMYLNHFFAFKVMPIVVFFSAFIGMLYYLGVMQFVIAGVSAVMQFTMGTTAGESLNAAGNIFVGQTEAPLMIKPILPHLTRSEIHAVMTGGFATIAGSVMATYILFGVPANHLLSASVMAAPTALAVSKLFYPETQSSKTRSGDVAKMGTSGEHNFIQAFSNGASASIGLVANIIVNLIAFISVLAFINAILSWLGGLAGIEPPDYPNFTFQFICSYLLWPVAFLMGVDAESCRKVAMLLGIKFFVNEFVAYTDLSQLINNRNAYEAYMVATNGTGNVTTTQGEIFQDLFLVGANKTLPNGYISERSAIISTYALCGFANLSSIGIVLGGLGAICPEKKDDIAKLVVRAMIAGNVVSYMNACVAGMLSG